MKFHRTIVGIAFLVNRAWSRGLQPLPEGCENFITSGYNISDPGSINFYEASTFITLSQAGTYTGPSAVFEYVGFASPSSPFFAVDDLLFEAPQFVGFAADPKSDDDTPFCQFSSGFLSKSQLQDPFATDGASVIFERASFVKYFWNPSTQKVDHMYVLFDDDFLEYFFGQLDTAPTAGLVCQVYSVPCSDILDPVENCPVQFAELPLVQEGTYIDGKSKGCRFLHSVFAGSGLPGAAQLHCPHISFGTLPDLLGIVKCQDDLPRVSPDDLFTEADFELWDSFKVKMFGKYGNTSLQVVGNPELGIVCPRGKRYHNCKCKKMCKGGLKLGIDPSISSTVKVCIPTN